LDKEWRNGAYIHTYIHTDVHTYIHTYIYTYIQDPDSFHRESLVNAGMYSFIFINLRWYGIYACMHECMFAVCLYVCVHGSVCTYSMHVITLQLNTGIDDPICSDGRFDCTCVQRLSKGRYNDCGDFRIMKKALLELDALKKSGEKWFLSVGFRRPHLDWEVLYCIVLYCIVLYCIVLYCITHTHIHTYIHTYMHTYIQTPIHKHIHTHIPYIHRCPKATLSSTTASTLAYLRRKLCTQASVMMHSFQLRTFCKGETFRTGLCSRPTDPTTPYQMRSLLRREGSTG